MDREMTLVDLLLYEAQATADWTPQEREDAFADLAALEGSERLERRGSDHDPVVDSAYD